MEFIGSEYHKRLRRADGELFDLAQFLLKMKMRFAADQVCQARLRLSDAENNVRGLLHTTASVDDIDGPCVFPVGLTTCGYTHSNHTRVDGSEMDHEFLSRVAVEKQE